MRKGDFGWERRKTVLEFHDFSHMRVVSEFSATFTFMALFRNVIKKGGKRTALMSVPFHFPQMYHAQPVFLRR